VNHKQYYLAIASWKGQFSFTPKIVDCQKTVEKVATVGKFVKAKKNKQK